MSAVPAVLVCDAGTCNLKIAGLTVLDRMVVAAHRAGCAPIFLSGGEAAVLKRAHQLGIKTLSAQTIDDAVAAALRRREGERSGAAGRLQRLLLIDAAILIEALDLERVMDANGHLATSSGSPLPVRMIGAESPPVVASGLAVPIHDAASAREAERQLWASLGSSADGLVDRYFNRPLGRFLSKALVHTSISPNQVSIISILIGVASAFFFANGRFILGALLLQLSAMIDCVDGELARVLFRQSPFGQWLDLLGDQVVHVSVFAAIGVGVARRHPEMPALILGASAALGVLLSLPLLVRALRRPAPQRPPSLNRLIDAAANRDFSVLLLALALIDRMHWFLWMAGIGVHIFWMALMVFQRNGRPKPVLLRTIG